eukprot:ctg_747.g393
MALSRYPEPLGFLPAIPPGGFTAAHRLRAVTPRQPLRPSARPGLARRTALQRPPRRLQVQATQAAPAPLSQEGVVKKDRVNFAIIGAGRIGQVHAEHIAFRIRRANLIGVASGTRALAERCSLLAGCEPYYDYHEMLDNPEVDAVCICSASNQHTKQMIEAAEAGKHIFVEKPIDTDLAKIDEALLAVRKAGVKLQVGFNRRFDTNYMRIRKAIATGEIGDTHLFHIVSRDPQPPPAHYSATSGGIWLDCSIHDFDMARFLIGDEIDEVYAQGAVRIVSGLEEYGDVDTSLVMLKFRNRTMGTIDNSRQAVYQQQLCQHGHRQHGGAHRTRPADAFFHGSVHRLICARAGGLLRGAAGRQTGALYRTGRPGAGGDRAGGQEKLSRGPTGEAVRGGSTASAGVGGLGESGVARLGVARFLTLPLRTRASPPPHALVKSPRRPRCRSGGVERSFQRADASSSSRNRTSPCWGDADASTGSASGAH